MPSCILVKTPLITFHENNLTAADSQTKINLELAAVQITKRKTQAQRTRTEIIL